LGGGARLSQLGSCGGVRLGSDGDNQLGWSDGDRHVSGHRPGCDDGDGLGSGHDSSGVGQLGGAVGQLGSNGRNHPRCARAHSDRLGSYASGGERLGRDGGEERNSYVNTEGLRVGSRYSEGMLGHGVDSYESENDG
jgi:hypothetical protein